MDDPLVFSYKLCSYRKSGIFGESSKIPENPREDEEGTGTFLSSRGFEGKSPKFLAGTRGGRVYIPAIVRGYFGDGDNSNFGDLTGKNPRNSLKYKRGRRCHFRGFCPL